VTQITPQQKIQFSGLRSNREIVGRSRPIQNDSGLPQGPADLPPAGS
jgi:hypothetical protein